VWCRARLYPHLLALPHCLAPSPQEIKASLEYLGCQCQTRTCQFMPTYINAMDWTVSRCLQPRPHVVSILFYWKAKILPAWHDWKITTANLWATAAHYQAAGIRWCQCHYNIGAWCWHVMVGPWIRHCTNDRALPVRSWFQEDSRLMNSTSLKLRLYTEKPRRPYSCCCCKL